MRVFLVTGGTSLLTNLQASLEGRPPGDAEIEEFALSTPLTVLSAESHSLTYLDWQPNDRVVLLHTETEEGRRCAELLKRRFEAEDGQIELVSVPGLDQTGSAFENAIREFGELLKGQIVNARLGGQLPIILATGGFKAMAMMAAAVAAIEKAQIYYVRQDFADLAQLPLDNL